MNISAVVKETAPLCNYKKGRRQIEEYNALPLSKKKLITRTANLVGEYISRTEIFEAAKGLVTYAD